MYVKIFNKLIKGTFINYIREGDLRKGKMFFLNEG
jgi:hypothetical protein